MLGQQAADADIVADLDAFGVHDIQKKSVGNAGETVEQHPVQPVAVAPDRGAAVREACQRCGQQFGQLDSLLVDGVFQCG